MFCFKCGAELPDDAAFCMICGVAQKNAGIAQNSANRQGRWEYDEFCVELEPFTKGKKFKSESTYYEDSLPYTKTEMNVYIEQAIRVILEQISREGWEPNEPIDTEHLWTAQRVKYIKGHSLVFPNPNRYEYVLVGVCLYCKRWDNGIG